ncbi:MAG: hypothetical protein M3417_03200 [Actinomycetota bacterium]|nr:hypothetical protein [Actinomycetota bacterium]
MRLLVLSTDPVDADAVRSALGSEAELDGADVLVVSPALNQSALAFWVSDSDEAIADAESAAQETVVALVDGAGRVRGEVGESEPLLALQDAMATFPADRILVFTRPEDEQRYREEDVVNEAQRRFGVPVDERTLGA